MRIMTVHQCSVRAIDCLYQTDNLLLLHPLDTCYVSITHHQILIILPSYVAVNHISALPFIERATPSGQFPFGRTRNNFYQIYSPSDKRIHTLSSYKELHSLPFPQCFRCLGKEAVSQYYFSHNLKILSFTEYGFTRKICSFCIRQTG